MKWSAREDRILKDVYPDYRRMQRRLPKRTYSAIRHRVRALGIAKQRHIWTVLEEKRLRKLYAHGAARVEIAAAFPHLRQQQIFSKVSHLGLTRAQGAAYLLDVPEIDSVRQQAAVQGLTLRELDRRAKTGRYFQKSTKRVNWARLAKAVERLGGRIEIRWNPVDF